MGKPTVISLYSGAGGLDYGFEAAGFRTAAVLELDPTCCETLRANRRWPVLEGDITGYSTDAILEAAQLDAGEPDVLIGGPPCQPFSKSGYWASGDAKRLEDPRSNTLHAYMRVLEETRPKAFLLENVPGLAFNGKDEGLLLLLEMLHRINRTHGTRYRPSVQQLNAADYGVPQLRQRVFVIGSRDRTEFRFPPSTHCPPEALEVPRLLKAELEPYRTAWDALAHVKNDDDVDLAWDALQK
jgi:DNA (cytosine-5)-methyltransferase 1